AAFGDVTDKQFGHAARPPDCKHDPLAARPVQIDGRDFGAFGGEQLRNLLADVAARASDDRHLILELHALAQRSPPRCHYICRRWAAIRAARGSATNMIGELFKKWITP